MTTTKDYKRVALDLVIHGRDEAAYEVLKAASASDKNLVPNFIILGVTNGYKLNKIINKYLQKKKYEIELYYAKALGEEDSKLAIEYLHTAKTLYHIRNVKNEPLIKRVEESLAMLEQSI